MSEEIVQLNEEVIKAQIKELVRGSVEEKRRPGQWAAAAALLWGDLIWVFAFIQH